MTSVYNKLFTKILDSSIWLEDNPTRIVWITLLAAMDEESHVQFSSIGNLAARARVTNEQAQAAVEKFLNPDPDSGDPEFDGRRIERVPGGYIILNGQKYRSLVTKLVARERTRERVQRYRERNAVVTASNVDVTPSEAEAVSDKDQERERKSAPYGASPPCPVDKIVELYHEILPELPKCQKITSARRSAIQQRWREDLTDLDDWAYFFGTNVRESDFLMGRSAPTNGRPVFRADIGWLTNPTNFTKIIEGKYRGKASR